jgi:Tol biopolymer transport system component
LRSVDQRRKLTLASTALLAIVFGAAGCGQGAGGPSGSSPPRRNGEILFVVGHSQLYLMRADGTHQRPMTSVPPDTSGASWSPDGKRIAYGRSRNAGEQCDLYVANADGTHARRLRRDGWCSDHPAWSPDGRRLAFDRRQPGVDGKTSIWTINVGGTDLRQVTHGDLDLDPTWSADGTTIAFARAFHGIWLVDADGSNERQLTTRGEDDQPDWSPDGEWIAFSREDGEYQGSTGSTRAWVDICVIRPDGGDLRRLTRHAGVNFWPAWSPDGKRIVFQSDRAHEDLFRHLRDERRWNAAKAAYPQWLHRLAGLASTAIAPPSAQELSPHVPVCLSLRGGASLPLGRELL